MGKNPPTRDEQRQFAADKFRFLRQVALNPELPPLASRFAILLLARCNLEFDGVGWAGQDTLAEELGCTRWTVNRLFALLVKHGHLTYKRGGWGATNRYQMAFKEQATDVTKPSHQEGAEKATDVRFSSHSDVRFSPHESILSNEGQASLAPEREIGSCAAAASGGPGLRPPRRRQKKEKEGVGGAGGVNGAAVPHLQELATLRGLWVRGWAADASERQRKADAAAWTAALGRGATPDAILAAAPKHVAAADAPRYLDKLQDWLNDDGWKKPPPKRKQANGANGAGRRRRSRSNGSSPTQEIDERIIQRLREAGHE